MENVIFIAGPGRSGTTVTRKILERHSQIVALPFESRFIIDPDGIVDFYCAYSSSWSPYLADRRIKRLEQLLLNLANEPPFHRFFGRIIKKINKIGLILSPKIYTDWELARHIPDYEKYVKELISELRKFSFPSIWRGTESYKFFPKLYYGAPKPSEELKQILGKFLRKVFASLLKKKGAKVYVDDSPWNLLAARELLKLLPEAKIIHVLRDPRDVVASFCHQNWSPKNVKEATIYYKDIIQYWFSIKSEIPYNKYFEFKLEDLVANPEFIARKICDFISLPYESQIIKLDLSKSHIGRWEKEFSDDQKKQLQEALNEIVLHFGYK